MVKTRIKPAALAQDETIAEICKLAKIPESKASAFSRVIRSIIVEHQGPSRTQRRLPYQCEVIPPLNLLIKRLEGLEEILPTILADLKDDDSDRGILLRAGLGTRTENDLSGFEDKLRLLKNAAKNAKRHAAGFPKNGTQIGNAQFMLLWKELWLAARYCCGSLTFCDCGRLATLAFPNSAGRDVWFCLDCQPVAGRA